MLELQELRVTLGGRDILAGISFVIRPGEIALIAGHNGAGKSTLLKAIFGSVPTSGGRILLDGVRMKRGGRSSRRGIVYLPQDGSVFTSLTVAEHQRLYQAYGGHFPPLTRSGLDNGAYAGSLSGGERQLLSLERLTSSNAGVLLLDEPLAGLARDRRSAALRDVARASGPETITLLVAHEVSEAIHIADRLIVLRQGSVVFDERTSELREDQSRISVALTT